jgi:hypothetical protein
MRIHVTDYYGEKKIKNPPIKSTNDTLGKLFKGTRVTIIKKLEVNMDLINSKV